MPSTNLRILVTLILAIATGVKVLATGWNPHVEWLGFLSLWAGLDVAQYFAKRKTDAEYVEAKAATGVDK
jgi:hypothetical protein